MGGPLNAHGAATLGQEWLQSCFTLRRCGVCATLPHAQAPGMAVG